jgi:hypothetical protein
MFKFIDIRPSDLDKIYEIRNQSQSGFQNSIDVAGGESQELAFPHETYTVGLSSLKSSDILTPEPIGIRVIEASKDNFNFIYDVNKTAGGSVPQMFHDRKFIKSYETAFSNILGSEMEQDNYTVRTVRIPAFYIDALWLHNPDNPEADKYLPVRTTHLFEKNKLYDKEGFFSILKNAASTYDLEDNMLGG